MEFAFSAILLLIILLPGFILQSAYTKGFWRWNSPTSARSLTEQIPAAVVLSSILHVVWASLTAQVGYPISLDAVVMLLLGSYGHEEGRFAFTISAFTNHPYKVFFYFTSLYVASALLGYVSHSVVRNQAWDRSTRILRFNNQWYYLLTGEITEFKESPYKFPEIDGVLLTAVVHHQEQDWLYIGLIEDFFFDKSGALDRVLMTSVQRRKLSEDKESDGETNQKYYEIEGDYFVLRYTEMSTINLDYIFVSTEPEPAGQSLDDRNA